MKLVVIGGGSGANSILPAFESIPGEITFVVPISDNGGSTSEIIRVLGGPAIGDARSRLVRLMPPGPVKQLFAYRLPNESSIAGQHWVSIVDGSHEIWSGISPYMKNIYGAFCIHVHSQLLKRRLTSNQPFDFSASSVGNLLLSGARMFFGGSLESAIEFVILTTKISPKFRILPCINSSHTHHIAAKLVDGTTVVGQNDISHPNAPVSTSSDSVLGGAVTTNAKEGQHKPGGNSNGTTSLPIPSKDSSPSIQNHKYAGSRYGSSVEQANAYGLDDDTLPFSHPRLSKSQINFCKDLGEPLPSLIDRVFYVNMYGDEIRPSASPRMLESMYEADCIVYSVGSLWTSIVPILLLQGVADALAPSGVRAVYGSGVPMHNGGVVNNSSPKPLGINVSSSADNRECQGDGCLTDVMAVDENNSSNLSQKLVPSQQPAFTSDAGSLDTLQNLLNSGHKTRTNAGDKKLILILNGKPDRETPAEMKPGEFVDVITRAILNSRSADGIVYVTHMIYPADMPVSALIGIRKLLNIQCIPACCPNGCYEAHSIEAALRIALEL